METITAFIDGGGSVLVAASSDIGEWKPLSEQISTFQPLLVPGSSAAYALQGLSSLIILLLSVCNKTGQKTQLSAVNLEVCAVGVGLLIAFVGVLAGRGCVAPQG